MIQTNQITRQSLEYYLNLKYPVILYPDEEGGYTAEIEKLRGCLTQGETLEEVMENIEDARILWITTAYEHRDNIPIPSTEISYSGKTLLRMPRSLHQELVEGAEEQGVSLNQYLVYLLSQRHTLTSILYRLNTMNIKGIKKGQNIQLTDDISNIPDGTPILVKISEPVLTKEEKQKKLDEILGAWQNNPDIDQDKILQEIQKADQLAKEDSTISDE